MNLIGTAGNGSNSAHRRVQHDRVAGGDAERAEVAGELTA